MNVEESNVADAIDISEASLDDFLKLNKLILNEVILLLHEVMDACMYEKTIYEVFTSLKGCYPYTNKKHRAIQTNWQGGKV